MAVDLATITTMQEAERQGWAIDRTRGKGRNSGQRYYRVYIPPHTVVVVGGIERVSGGYTSEPTPEGAPIRWGKPDAMLRSPHQRDTDTQRAIAEARRENPGAAALADRLFRLLPDADEAQQAWLDAYNAFRSLVDRRFRYRCQYYSQIYDADLVALSGLTVTPGMTRLDLYRHLYDRLQEG
jgi:hypothetical protein